MFLFHTYGDTYRIISAMVFGVVTVDAGTGADLFAGLWRFVRAFADRTPFFNRVRGVYTCV